MKMHPRDWKTGRLDSSGQAITEYILLLVAIAGAFLLLSRSLANFDVMSRYNQLLTGNFARAFQYGRVDAQGYAEGGFQNHPRGPDGDGDVRIFYVFKTN